MDSFIAKQAITDENLTIVGYELLFRNSEKNRYPEGVSESLATKKIIWQQFVDDTIDRVVESDKLCFINFPEDLLIDGYAEILPKDKVVIEVLENTIPTEKLLSVIRGLREKGYLFALDDVTRTVFENWHDYLSLFDFVKIDTRRIDDDFLKLFFSLKPICCIALAEKVETNEQLESLKKNGFLLFQGFYLDRPKVLRCATTEYANTESFELLIEVIKRDFNPSRLELILIRNPKLTVGLLKYVNTIGKPLKPISSIQHAIVYLGLEQLRMFVFLLCSSTIHDKLDLDKYVYVLTRAKFCELMMGEIDHKLSSMAFISGMLSLSHLFLPNDNSELLSSLPISNDMRDAVLCRAGILGDVISASDAYQNAKWCEALDFLNKYKIKIDGGLSKLYMDAIEWSSECRTLMKEVK